ncbi:Probable NAD kinase 2, chloroplastic [Seminavis robusta]|uniref:Probable NAD kinase 2, chloroplastic n=1 Tax=Seminavis robusta TaxID=568900 RepID=A0A9N8E6R2_9STRA|nr:Probable NAD kinase 2, chloroplastic [Seminavis robusta]|eukprot:Sro722_g192820.1 Probable NAD kinase 2, chloroplastic (604) ;mRNA; r:9782-11685
MPHTRETRLLAISCLLITQNISLVAGFQALSYHHTTATRKRSNAWLMLLQERPTSISDDEATENDNKPLFVSDETKPNGDATVDPVVNGSDSTSSTDSGTSSPVQEQQQKVEEESLEETKKKQPPPKRGLGLMWCAESFCKDAVRERVRGEHNQIILDGPATGQVAYYWKPHASSAQVNDNDNSSPSDQSNNNILSEPSILLLVKPNDDGLIQVASDAVRQLTNDSNNNKIHVSLDSSLAGKLKFRYGVDNSRIHLFEPDATEGFGGSHVDYDDTIMKDFSGITPEESQPPYDLICTLGGDGLLMHASMLFQGPVPPVISIAGGSLGFLTQFSRDEMVDAIRIALGLSSKALDDSSSYYNKDPNNGGAEYYYGDDTAYDNVFPPNMPSYPYEPLLPPKPQQQLQGMKERPRFAFGLGDRICLSIRMRLDCRIFNPEGVVRARFNVLNEVVIDRGSSPYLAALECFCDDVHLTTVQADGVIFATPTGSTAYSMAAGGSVVHPAVPCIMVTPICPHVLSFRSMIFPDHVVLRCYVPQDARADAAVAFDGRYRRELHRGDSLQIQMSKYPVPTLNRADHSSDWLGSLKRSFNFNSRPRQKPFEMNE